jgi:hypothetical protein
MKKIIVTEISQVPLTRNQGLDITLVAKLDTCTLKESNYICSNEFNYILCDRIDKLYVEHREEIEEFLQEKYPEEFI